MKARPDLERGNAVEWIRSVALQFCKGDGLDVGCGRWAVSRTAIGVDLQTEVGHLTGPADSLYWFRDEVLDYVFSSHCLEHVLDWKKALTEWIRVLKPGGILFLYIPHPSYLPWSKEHHPQHNFNLERPEVSEFLTRHRRMKPVAGVDGPDEHMSWWAVFKKDN